MPDVFLSYSRKDSPEAIDLASRLRELGIDVWIDQEGINVATIWSAEIAAAIRESRAFLILLSEYSLGSSNVRKEIALATQYSTPILPLELRPVAMPVELSEYFEGLLHVPHTSTEGILNALRHYGIDPGKPPSALSGPRSLGDTAAPARKSLMVLPFQDHSPSKDNAWFADGLVTELISALSKTKQLRLIDWSTTKEYKGKAILIPQLAEELDVRFFVEGSVRTFGEQVKINTQLFDAYEEAYLWSDTFKGELSDIFEIQESVASRVVEGLNVTLSSDEHASLRDRGTTDVQAYHFWLKAQEQYSLHTKDSWLNAVIFDKTASRLDPQFARARVHAASTLVEMYRLYDRNPALLDEAEEECEAAQAADPEDAMALGVLARIALQRKAPDKAYELAKSYVAAHPDLVDSRYTLALICQLRNDVAEAVLEYEACIRLDPNRIIAYWNLVVACEQAGQPEKQQFWARQAIPHFERRLRLNEQDENAWVWLTNLLYLSGEEAAAIEQLKTLPEMHEIGPLYNLACFADRTGQKSLVIPYLRRAVAAGLDNLEMLEDGWAEFKEDPGYQDLLQGLRARISAKVT